MSREPPRWPLQGPVRMPLQIGVTSLIDATIASAAGMTIAVLAVVHAADGDVLGLAIAGVGVLVLGGLVWLSYGSMTGCRACDVVMDRDGLRIEGGPRHGLALRWAEIVAETGRVENDRVPDGEGKPIRGRQLRIGKVSGEDVLLAEIYQNDDRDAFYVVLDEIRAVHGLPALPPEERTEPVQAELAVETTVAVLGQLQCPTCGAAAPPRDASHVVCRHCNGHVEVPRALRRRLAADAKLATQRSVADTRLAEILEQPGAHVANRRLLVGALLVLAAPIPCGLLYAALRSDGASWWYALPLAIASVALVCLALAATSSPFVRRVALRSCLIELGARRREDDDRPACRGCGGLLPEIERAVVVVCSYCACENVLGIDLRPWQQAEGTRQKTLSELLEKRREGMRNLRTNAVVCIVFAVIALAWPIWRLM
jgi:hypothetical protein